MNTSASGTAFAVRRIFAGFLAIAAVLSSTGTTQFQVRLLPANSVELLLDNYMIDDMQGISRQIVEPDLLENNPRIYPDQPWEGRLVTYGSALWDESRKIHRFWYLSSFTDAGIPAGIYQGAGEYQISYAESADPEVPVSWTKPLLGGSYGNWSRTNIVIPEMHGVSVFIDESDPVFRYKGAGGIAKVRSMDGIVWEQAPWPYGSDTGTSLTRIRNKWRAFTRDYGTWDSGGYPSQLRRVGVVSATDFWGDWTPEVPIPSLDTDDLDGAPWTQPYQLTYRRYGNQGIGLYRLIRLEQTPGNNSLGTTEVQLVTSRDDFVFERVADRAVWLAPRPGWMASNVIPPQTWYRRDDKLIFVFGASAARHGEEVRNYRYGVATLQVDRFERKVGEGYIETYPLEVEGSVLVLNADGNVTVSVRRQDGSALAGFSAAEAVVTRLDALRMRIDWAGGSLLDARKKAGEDVRLRFEIGVGGALYGFIGWDGTSQF